MNWGKFESTNQAFQKITAQNQHFKIQILNLWMNWEKLCPNLSVTTVENDMGDSLKKFWSHFKLNIKV